MLKRILTKCNGLLYPQDFLCLPSGSQPDQLKLYLVDDGKVLKDISSLHAFVGYSPVVFAIPDMKEIGDGHVVETIFSTERLSTGQRYNLHCALARLVLIKLKIQNTARNSIIFYEAVSGKHRFILPFHQSVGQLYNHLYNRNAGNVFLKGNRLKQVQMAYAIPRKISLITVGLNGLYNLFPTDLHGQVVPGHYLISLRHAGKACEQVLKAKQILLSDMDASAYKSVYQLGKSHMQPLKEAAAFDFDENASEEFCLPMPKAAVAYKELLLQETFDVGIHKLMLFRITNEVSVGAVPQTLVHVHNLYATWRRKNGYEGNYLLR